MRFARICPILRAGSGTRGKQAVVDHGFGAGARIALALLLLTLAQAATARAAFKDSAYLVPVQDPGTCDVVVTPANFATTLLNLNDPTKRVFCVDPGDYRSIVGITLSASGTPASPRFLRFNGPGAVKAFERVPQALFERLDVRGSWWVLQGLTIRPQSPTTVYMLSLTGADHVVVDGNLIDGVEHPNGFYQSGVEVLGRLGDPATDNSIQRNVIRNGDQTHAAGDYTGVLISAGLVAGENNDRNAVLDNEIYDWGDAVALSGWSATCSEPGRPHGTVIDGNDLLVTAAKRVDCDTGAADPDGECACAENGVDLKIDPGADPADWTRITNNRLSGFRPTTEAVVCGGSGALGQAITAGNECPGHVFVARNRIGRDATVGVTVAGTSWIVAGNLIHDIQISDGHLYSAVALLPVAGSSGHAFQWNTIVDVANAYDDCSDDTDTRCNVVIESPEWIWGGQPRGQNHVTEYNYLFAAGYSNLLGPSNEIFDSAAESANTTLCYDRRRWSGAETICVPWAASGSLSPQQLGAPHCNAAIGAPFGIASIGYWKKSSKCGIGAELVVLLAWGARRHGQR